MTNFNLSSSDPLDLATAKNRSERSNRVNTAMTTESIDDLWAYCQSNNRVVPLPQRWATLYKMLKPDTGDLQGKRPASPLILAAWDATSAIEKTHRLREHLECAVDHNQLDEVGHFLRSLSDDQWSYR